MTARQLVILGLAVAYGSAGLLVAFGVVPVWSLGVFLTLPLGLRLASGRDRGEHLRSGVLRWFPWFGAYFALGYVIERIVR